MSERIGKARTAVSYLRVSSRGQIEGDGFPRQRAAVEGYAKANNIDVVGEFKDEGVSGSMELDDRDGLAELVARIKEGDVDLVLVENASRLARDLLVGELLLRQLTALKVQVIAADSGTDLSASDGDPTRTLIRQVLGAVAEFEKSALVQKLAAARRRARKANGRCEGPRPFGELPGEERVVSRIRELTRRRRGKKRRTLSEIADTLNAEGLKPRNALAWSPANVHAVAKRLGITTRRRA